MLKARRRRGGQQRLAAPVADAARGGKAPRRLGHMCAGPNATHTRKNEPLAGRAAEDIHAARTAARSRRASFSTAQGHYSFPPIAAVIIECTFVDWLKIARRNYARRRVKSRRRLLTGAWANRLVERLAGPAGSGGLRHPIISIEEAEKVRPPLCHDAKLTVAMSYFGGTKTQNECNTSSFLVKRNGNEFAREKFNLLNRNCRKYSGLASTKAVDISIADKKVTLTTKIEKAAKKPVKAENAVPLRKGARGGANTIRANISRNYYRRDLKKAALAKWSRLSTVAKVEKGVLQKKAIRSRRIKA
ncbi:hypothetical protein ON010_g18462 [Phytophthora cinnamomi]|nr:hypothetical protein ON010_g18462 [Phytophthora cinnamomi]